MPARPRASKRKLWSQTRAVRSSRCFLPKSFRSPMPTEAIRNAFGKPPTELYIGGEWRRRANDPRLEVLNPASGAVLASVASGGVADALDAVASAHDALPKWSAT